MSPNKTVCYDWWFIGLYASCDVVIRKEQWRVVKDRSRLWGDKWIITGDFNDITSNDEKWGGRVREEWTFRDFRNFIESNNLVDIGFVGNPWTWSNNWDRNGEVKERLDRALCNAGWFHVFDRAQCKHVENLGSDHSMLLIDSCPPQGKKKKRFSFDKRWLQREGMKQVVERAWRLGSGGSRMFKVKKKIVNCRIELLKWRNKFQGNSRRRIEDLKHQLEELRKGAYQDKRERSLDLKNQLKKAYEDEKVYWSQKARVSWLREGDRNTQYFHACTKGRRKRNKILNLQRGDGTWTLNEQEIGVEVEEYYLGLFTSSGAQCLEEILHGIPHSITDQMNNNLTKPVEEKEVKKALFSMHPNKAPGPDGMSPLFFQKFWTTIKKEVVNAIQTFFHTGHLLKSVNHTVITLIPKVLNPTSLKQFRPISLCNTMYKVIAKILANRLKGVLHCCICKNQSAFIPGSQILRQHNGLS